MDHVSGAVFSGGNYVKAKVVSNKSIPHANGKGVAIIARVEIEGGTYLKWGLPLDPNAWTSGSEENAGSTKASWKNEFIIVISCNCEPAPKGTSDHRAVFLKSEKK
jgi:hypothetical protein